MCYVAFLNSNYTSFCHTCRETEFELKLEKSLKELELLKEQRNQQKQVADSAMRQRDMYRILLQSAGVDLPPQGELTVVERYKTTVLDLLIIEQSGSLVLNFL